MLATREGVCQSQTPTQQVAKSCGEAVRPCGPGPCSSRLSLGEFQKPAATHASLRTEGSREALVLLQLWQACAVLKCVKPAFKNRGRSHWCLEMAGLTALGRGPCGSMGGVRGRGFGRLLLLGPPCPLQHPLTLSQKPPGPGAPVCALRPTQRGARGTVRAREMPPDRWSFGWCPPVTHRHRGNAQNLHRVMTVVSDLVAGQGEREKTGRSGGEEA